MTEKKKRDESRIESQRKYDRKPDVIARKAEYKKEKGIVTIGVTVYKSQKEKLSSIAKEKGISLSNLVKLALEDYCDIDMSSYGAEEND